MNPILDRHFRRMNPKQPRHEATGVVFGPTVVVVQDPKDAVDHSLEALRDGRPAPPQPHRWTRRYQARHGRASADGSSEPGMLSRECCVNSTTAAQGRMARNNLPYPYTFDCETCGATLRIQLGFQHARIG